jgi:hypothetical protein
MSKPASSALPDDLGKWLTLLAALAAVGILPRGWQRNLAAASAILAALASL